MKARVLESEPSGSRHCFHELRLVAQSRVVDENRERLAVLLESSHGTLRPVLGYHEHATVSVHELATFG